MPINSHNSLKNPSFEEATLQIYSINFSRIIKKLVLHRGWLADDAEETCKLYRNFLLLKKKYPQAALPPSEDIDEFWHNHILDTEAYEKDCSLIFGSLLHHYPYLGIDGVTDLAYLNKAFEETQALYYKEFGNYILPTRSKYPKLLYWIMKKISSNKS